MNMQNGTISNWNDEKGFGFILPKSGAKTIFAHIKDYSREHKPPIKGLEVSYLISTDPRGRTCAVEIRPVNGHKKVGREFRQKVLSLILLSTFAIILFYLYSSSVIPLSIVGIYAFVSIVTFAMYAKDKNAAEWGQWRTQESTLHVLALVGGWPGASIAQSFLRHKSKKLSFRVTYWITVIINCGVLVWLISPEGSFWLKNVMKNINFG